eukprot:Nk52_evm54s1992 gene=Nk52_evmTU54s1992
MGFKEIFTRKKKDENSEENVADVVPDSAGVKDAVEDRTEETLEGQIQEIPQEDSPTESEDRTERNADEERKQPEKENGNKEAPKEEEVVAPQPTKTKSFTETFLSKFVPSKKEKNPTPVNNETVDAPFEPDKEPRPENHTMGESDTIETSKSKKRGSADNGKDKKKPRKNSFNVTVPPINAAPVPKPPGFNFPDQISNGSANSDENMSYDSADLVSKPPLGKTRPSQKPKDIPDSSRRQTLREKRMSRLKKMDSSLKEADVSRSSSLQEVDNESFKESSVEEQRPSDPQPTTKLVYNKAKGRFVEEQELNPNSTSAKPPNGNGAVDPDDDPDGPTQEALYHMFGPEYIPDPMEDTLTKNKKPTESTEAQRPRRRNTFVNNILSLTIHRSDLLRPSSYITHPVVRIHVVSKKTGMYLSKKNPEKSAVEFYENGSGNQNGQQEGGLINGIDFIIPVITKPFDFKKEKSLTPIWNETILINEDYLHLVDEDTLVLFEVLDFVGTKSELAKNHFFRAKNTLAEFFSVKKKDFNSDYETFDGWYRIAWGFFKLVNSFGEANTEKCARLQLYEYPNWMRRAYFEATNFDQNVSAIYHDRIPPVYYCWNVPKKFMKKTPKAYPGTLFITMKGVVSPEVHEVKGRSMNPCEKERGSISYEQLVIDTEARIKSGLSASQQRINMPEEEEESGMPKGPTWKRMPGQLCQIPNKVKYRLPSGTNGCFTVKFSPNGLYVACGCAEIPEEKVRIETLLFPIRIYSVVNGSQVIYLEGHRDIIYDICWDESSNELISASADGTCCLWDIRAAGHKPVRIFAHPCYVYAAQFHPQNGSLNIPIIATGGYDHVVRLWSRNTVRNRDETSSKGEMRHVSVLQELHGHEGTVNALCFDKDGIRLFTGDGKGEIKVWNSPQGAKLVQDMRRSSISNASQSMKYASPMSPTVDLGTVHNTYEDDNGSDGDQAFTFHKWQIFDTLALSEIKGRAISALRLHPTGRKMLVQTKENSIHTLDLRTLTFMAKYSCTNHSAYICRGAYSACGTFTFSGNDEGKVMVWNTETTKLETCYSNLQFTHPVCDVDFHPKDNYAAFASFGGNQPVYIYGYDAMVEAAANGTADPVSQKMGTDTIGVISRWKDMVKNNRMSETQIETKLRKVAEMLTSVKTSTPGRRRTTYYYDDQKRGSHRHSFFGPENTGLTRSSLPSLSTGSARRSSSLGYNPRSTYLQGTSQENSTLASNFSYELGNSFKGSLDANNHNPKRSYFTALFDYTAIRADELTFKKGDTIVALEHQTKNTPDWWYGFVDGSSATAECKGYFPTNYVREATGRKDRDKDDENRGVMFPTTAIPVAPESGYGEGRKARKSLRDPANYAGGPEKIIEDSSEGTWTSDKLNDKKQVSESIGALKKAARRRSEMRARRLSEMTS